jgi:hypothetical protein
MLLRRWAAREQGSQKAENENFKKAMAREGNMRAAKKQGTHKTTEAKRARAPTVATESLFLLVHMGPIVFLLSPSEFRLFLRGACVGGHLLPGVFFSDTSSFRVWHQVPNPKP